MDLITGLNGKQIDGNVKNQDVPTKRLLSVKNARYIYATQKKKHVLKC